MAVTFGLLPLLFFSSQLCTVQSLPCSGDGNETCAIRKGLTRDVSRNGDSAIELLQRKDDLFREGIAFEPLQTTASGKTLEATEMSPIDKCLLRFGRRDEADLLLMSKASKRKTLIVLLNSSGVGATSDLSALQDNQLYSLCKQAMKKRSKIPRFDTNRHLATVMPPHPVRLNKDNITLQFWSVVPTFGPQENYIAFVHQYTYPLWSSLQNFTLYCSGPNNSHPTAMRIFGNDSYSPYPRVMVWQCDWPKEEADLGHYEVSLQDASGNHIGQFETSYKPRLLGDYKTMACVPSVVYEKSDKEHPDRWHASPNTVRMLPQWIEYHLMHGIDHFLFYTFDDTAKQVMDVYQPYLDSHVATQVHMVVPDFMKHGDWTFDPDDKSRFNSGWTMTDCLYRAKNHAQWLMALDVDEFVRPGSGLHDILARAEVAAKTGVWGYPSYQVLSTMELDGVGPVNATLLQDNQASNGVCCVEFHRFQFFRPRDSHSLMLSSNTRENATFPGFLKAIVKPSLVNAMWPHGASSWSNGAVTVKLPPERAVINHYRLFSSTKVLVHDEVARAEAPALRKALESRFKMNWKALAAKLKKPKDLPSAPIQSQQAPGNTVVRADEVNDTLAADIGYPGCGPGCR